MLGARPHVNSHPFNAIRKAAYGFGWDWGPDLAGAGIWRPVGLHGWSVGRLASVRPVATVEDAGGRVTVHVGLELARESPELELSVEVAGHTATARVGTDAATVVVDVPEHLAGAVLLDDVREDFPGEEDHAGEQPCGGFPAMQGK